MTTASATGSLQGIRWKSLVELLESRSKDRAERCAFTFLENGEREGESLTFGELGRRARRVAAEVHRRGASGRTVALLYPSGLDFIAAFYGCLVAGATAVPASPPQSVRALGRLKVILGDAVPALALTTSAIEEALSPALGPGSPPLVATDRLRQEAEEAWVPPEVNGSDLALLQYTSGSTASPKGVVLTHKNVLHNQQLICDRFGHTERSVMVSWLPVFHDMGLIGKIIQPVFMGCSCVLMSPEAFLQDPGRWLRAISRYGGTTSGGPNFAYDLCVDRVPVSDRAGLELGSWEVAFNGSEPVRAGTLERFSAAYAPHGFRREAFYPCYGLAEATLLVAGGSKWAAPVVRSMPSVATDSGGKGGPRLVGCGSASPEQRLLIVNPETSVPLGGGEVGEIWVAGPSVSPGYWQRPDESERVVGARLASGEGPFLRTGDLGVLLDGELFVTGRLKEMMIVRGRNHYPQDIELTATSSHPALRTGCGAAFIADAGGAERIVLVQELRKEHLAEPPVNAIALAVREAVTQEHGIRVDVLALIAPGTIPKTSSGKIQRRLCRSLFMAGRLEVVARDPAMPGDGARQSPFPEVIS
jgi:acyl-CoA synthetase (AMP-forming)/AMP-acid ligase II